jgi:hypothetical protein
VGRCEEERRLEIWVKKKRRVKALLHRGHSLGEQSVNESAQVPRGSSTEKKRKSTNVAAKAFCLECSEVLA